MNKYRVVVEGEFIERIYVNNNETRKHREWFADCLKLPINKIKMVLDDED